ncbi:phosphotransferase family protein [Piscinibacter sakaiensis]|uniref:phosphotransferase family protein n=1 Tax=Piscinibacter sakaiensis TaxID=1547922 RepID=UPI003AACE453
MSELQPEERRAVHAALERMGLLRPGEQPPLTPLAGGVSSLIVRVDTAAGPLCLKRALPQLKVAALWQAPVERNRAEVAWMRVASRIVPDAVPRLLGDDADGNAFAMAFLDPSDHPLWKTRLLAGQAEPPMAAAVGGLLAAIHAATAGDADCARTFATDADFFALRLDPYFNAAAARHPQCADALHRLVESTAGTRLALVHGDVSPKNILLGPRGPVLLDAECAWYGDPAFDLAFCINHLLLKSVFRPSATEAYLRCIEAMRDAYLPAVGWEATAGFERRCAALIGGLLLARIDGKSPVEYITTDTYRERVRRAAVPLLLAPVTSLSDLIEHWKTTA